MATDTWSIFKDKVERALETWDKRHSDADIDESACIQGFLNEVDDTFTKTLLNFKDR